MDSVREKTSASNEPICKDEKAEFLIVQIVIDCWGIANDCFDCNQLFPPCQNIKNKYISTQILLILVVVFIYLMFIVMILFWTRHHV